jgi:hypothetical protein
MRAIDADALMESIGCADAVKYGNRDRAQQDTSYSTMMLYEIRNEIDAQPTVGGWISVKERLPEATKPDVHGNIAFSDYVLTYQTYKDGFRWITTDACRVDRGVWLHEVPGSGCKVTHWMPLPEPPKED